MKYRKSLTAEQIAKIKYPMPHCPISSWISLIFLVFVLGIMWLDADTRLALYIAPIWFGLVYASYYILIR